MPPPEDDPQTEQQDSNSSCIAPLEDTVIFNALIIFAVLFLYLFIHYLKRKPKISEADSSDSTMLQDRRFRFGRLRRNSSLKPWLEPLEPQDPFDLNDDDPDLRHDADRLIQSDISTETVLKELDPMGTLSKSSFENPEEGGEGSVAAASKDMLLCQCQAYEWLGIVLAAAVSFIFIVIFSNMDSE